MTQDKTLPGALIRFTNPGSCGYHTNQFGVGDMSISLQRPGAEYPWIDLGCIQFSCPTEKQLQEAEKVSKEHPYDPEGRAFSDIHRRVSKKQAAYINHLICEMLTQKLKGEIPPDDEIDVILKEIRLSGYPVAMERKRQLEKFKLTEKANNLLGEIRYLCTQNGYTFILEFGPEGTEDAGFDTIVKIYDAQNVLFLRTDFQDTEEQFVKILDCVKRKTMDRGVVSVSGDGKQDFEI